MKQNKINHKVRTFVLGLLIMTLLVFLVYAEPEGVEITSNTTQSALGISPDNRTDEGGTINTLTMNISQQTTNWKAYVGNVSGVIRLADSSGSSIFTWELGASEISGEIYSSRSGNVAWETIRCANSGIVSSEDTALGMSGVLNISQTFNETTHQEIVVGVTTINSNTCSSTSTYVNDAKQAQGSADFQLVLLDDETNLVFVNPINPSTTGYDGSLFDFQMIVPNNPSDTTTYFFYAEISG